MRFVTSRKSQVADGFAINREDSACGAELRRHVAESRPVCKRQFCQTIAVELYELADHALVAEHLRDGQYEVGRCRAFLEFARQIKSDDMRDQHRDWLTEHCRFGLDTANAPAEYAKGVDHRCMRVRADKRIRVSPARAVAVSIKNDAAQIFEVDLVDDARVRWHDAEVLKRRLPPAQERVALLVALEFNLVVEIE